MNRFGFEDLDFLKIDIEGAEPLLLESLKEKLGKIKSIFIEIGNKNKLGNYFPLIKLFLESGMISYTATGQRLGSYEEVIHFIGEGMVDLWFIQP